MCENPQTPSTHEDNTVRVRVTKPVTLLGCIFTLFLMSGCCALFLAMISLIIALGVFLAKALWLFVTYLWSLIG